MSKITFLTSSHKHKKNKNKLYEMYQEKVIKLTTKMIANIRNRYKTQICAIKKAHLLNNN